MLPEKDHQRETGSLENGHQIIQVKVPQQSWSNQKGRSLGLTESQVIKSQQLLCLHQNFMVSS